MHKTKKTRRYVKCLNRSKMAIIFPGSQALSDCKFPKASVKADLNLAPSTTFLELEHGYSTPQMEMAILTVWIFKRIIVCYLSVLRASLIFRKNQKVESISLHLHLKNLFMPVRVKVRYFRSVLIHTSALCS